MRIQVFLTAGLAVAAFAATLPSPETAEGHGGCKLGKGSVRLKDGGRTVAQRAHVSCARGHTRVVLIADIYRFSNGLYRPIRRREFLNGGNGRFLRRTARFRCRNDRYLIRWISAAEHSNGNLGHQKEVRTYKRLRGCA